MMLMVGSPLEVVLQIVASVKAMVVIFAPLEMKYWFELDYDVNTVYRNR